MINIPDNFLPTNENGESICPKCRKTVKACDCPLFDPTWPKCEKFTLSVRLDKKGRKGKVVTLIQGLPTEGAFLKDLAKLLKSRVGSGGTSYLEGEFGVIEVQGDHWEQIRQMLREQGFSVR